ncbi:quinoprotein dehydrogenase-associated putative ABC transporter substrate-binding protein [Ramlibacter terrae]|uniref:Quinoprotein dehydrogenase-associated putative ABC transporter substrate-binding protein n=1 Tax=Ramlibacter terrae TaxID=2732511 RepID=A0ABX6PAC4_9BURK|nr:quinoprotein dehydrogenase-associated putative ABC transporter substrate-binding protein [Ramlibacter terrae]
MRVCADPDNLPFSHEDGSGFENRIAALLAEDLGLRLEYAWLPDRRGFVRKTLGAELCDVIVGVPAGFERTSNTKPYYRSTYVLVAPASAAKVHDFHDPRLRHWRIGVLLPGDDMAATPPGHALMQVGAVDNVTGFTVPGDEPAAARMVHAMERGELDAAFLWGPQAGYFAARSGVPLRLQRVPAPAQVATQRFEFGIAMGVRRGDTALRDRLDAWLVQRRPDILRILSDYGVPLVEGARP